MGKAEIILVIVAFVLLVVSWYVSISAIKATKNYKRTRRVNNDIALSYAQRVAFRARYSRGRAYVPDLFFDKREIKDDINLMDNESKKQSES